MQVWTPDSRRDATGRSVTMPARPGTYVLILRSHVPRTIAVGRHGHLAVTIGFYLYVGSAFGPGGVLERVRRHCRDAKARHWHVDYLREATTPVGVWYSHAARRLEHRWASLIGRLPGAAAIAGFGCSDCRCPSHLFHFARLPPRARFEAAAGARFERLRIDAAAPAGSSLSSGIRPR